MVILFYRMSWRSKHVQSKGGDGKSDGTGERTASFAVRLPERARRGGLWGFG